MWTLERDPTLASGFANVTFLDRPADLDMLRARLLRAAALVPQLRRRVLVDPIRLAAPRWVDDPDFAVERHVRAQHLDPPGDRDQVLDIAMEFCHRAYDQDHPLWEFLLLDGLADGAGAMLQRFHHTISDGVGMVRMSEHFIDARRDAAAAAPVPFPETVPLPNAITASRDALGHRICQSIASLRHATTATGASLAHPTRIREAAGQGVRVARAVVNEAATTGRRLSPLWTERSLERTFRTLRVDFQPVRELAQRRGASVNDVFVAGAAGGAGAYHRIMGHPVTALRMAMPVNTRADRSAAGNAFDTARIVVSTDPDPDRRLAEDHDALRAVRERAATALPQMMAGPANLLPPAVVIRVARAQTAAVDFTTSNVRGAPFEVFMGGARVEANHPVGPLIGTAFNLTMLSYSGSLDMGLHIDTGAIRHPDLLARCIEDSFAEMLEGKGELVGSAGGASRARV